MDGPDQRILPWAEYATLEIIDGRTSVSLQRLPVDFEHIVRIAR
jgi:hypothetical protein